MEFRDEFFFKYNGLINGDGYGRVMYAGHPCTIRGMHGVEIRVMSCNPETDLGNGRGVPVMVLESDIERVD